MGIKEEIIKLLTEWNLSKSDNDRMNYFDATGITTGLLCLFDKEKKEFALEMLNKYIDKINELIPDFKEYYADSEYYPKELTATKLEGEK